LKFLDTNVLLYAISRDPEEVVKAEIANQVLERRDLATSVQVLQEFYVQATRPTREDALTHRQALALVTSFTRFPVQESTLGLATAAMDACHRLQISYWDAAILEAARAIGCDEVLSEDLSDGQDYAGVTVRNPFR
jgi:predicted nucleic acid-binding protein